MEFRDVSQDAWWHSGAASTAVWKAASLPVRAAALAAAGVPVPAPAAAGVPVPQPGPGRHRVAVGLNCDWAMTIPDGKDITFQVTGTVIVRVGTLATVTVPVCRLAS